MSIEGSPGSSARRSIGEPPVGSAMSNPPSAAAMEIGGRGRVETTLVRLSGAPRQRRLRA